VTNTIQNPSLSCVLSPSITFGGPYVRWAAQSFSSTASVLSSEWLGP